MCLQSPSLLPAAGLLWNFLIMIFSLLFSFNNSNPLWKSNNPIFLALLYYVRMFSDKHLIFNNRQHEVLCPLMLWCCGEEFVHELIVSDKNYDMATFCKHGSKLLSMLHHPVNRLPCNCLWCKDTTDAAMVLTLRTPLIQQWYWH